MIIDEKKSNGNGMTKAERDELLRLVKARAKVAKAGVDQRQAELLADFEAQLHSYYRPDDDALWAKAQAMVQEAAQEADKLIEQRSRELGIPEGFRPSIHASWNSVGSYRLTNKIEDLRRIAAKCLEADAKKAKLAIDAASVDMQTTLAAGALQSAEAKAFPESMPTPEGLMSPLELRALQAG